MDVLQQHQQTDPRKEQLLPGIKGPLGSRALGHPHYYGHSWGTNEGLVGSGCPAPCHVHIPVLSPLEGQGSCSSPGTGHCLQYSGTAVREFRHSLCWSWGWAASQRAQTLLSLLWAHPSTSAVLPKLWRRWQGFPYSLGCLQHTPEKNRSRASPQPAKKAPSGAPGTARSWHQT